MQISLPLAKPIPAGLSEELVKKSVYCSPHLQKLTVEDNGRALTLTIDDGASIEAVQNKVERFVASMVRGYRKFDRKVIFESDSQPSTYTPGVWEELLRRRWVFDSGFGQVGLAGPAFDLFRYFEATFVAMAEEHFGAPQYRFPTLIPAHVLGRCGYFNSFPHAVTFATHLHGDYDVLTEFTEANQSGPLKFPRNDALDTPDHCLTPVVCYHCYRTLEGATLKNDELRTFTAVGSCFRFESNNTTSLERLWDFTLREIVFVGPRETVMAKRQRCIEIVADWINRLGLRVRFETASDPFFTNDFSEKTYFQLVSDLKYEMRMAVDHNRTIAAGSFNIHNDFFGKAFSITSGESAAFSACIGFGLERWIYAFLCQKGLDPARWPDEVQPYVKRS